MANIESARLSATVEQAYRDLEAALRGITEDQLRAPPAPEEWSAAQVAGHVIEMGPLWARKTLEASRDPQAGLAGRTPQEQEARLASVRRYSDAPLREVLSALANSRSDCLAALRSLEDSTLEHRKRRQDGTEATVRGLVESLIASHVAEHARQIQSARAAASGR